MEATWVELPRRIRVRSLNRIQRKRKLPTTKMHRPIKTLSTPGRSARTYKSRSTQRGGLMGNFTVTPCRNNFDHLNSQDNWLEQETWVNGESSTAQVEEEGCEEYWEELLRFFCAWGLPNGSDAAPFPSSNTAMGTFPSGNAGAGSAGPAAQPPASAVSRPSNGFPAAPCASS